MQLTDEQKFNLLMCFVGNRAITASELPQLFNTVSSLGDSQVIPEQPIAPMMDKKDWKKLIKGDVLISLLNQKPYKTLKRHLAAYNYTPESYREAFGLPADFPMVSPAYSKVRSEKAKAMGFGQKAAA